MNILVSLWKRFREPKPGDPCPLGGRVLPVQDYRRVVWGGTMEDPWPSSLSRGCPKCGETGIALESADELPMVVPAPFMQDQLKYVARPRVRLEKHLIPHRVVGRVRKFSKGEING